MVHAVVTFVVDRIKHGHLHLRKGATTSRSSSTTHTHTHAHTHTQTLGPRIPILRELGMRLYFWNNSSVIVCLIRPSSCLDDCLSANIFSGMHLLGTAYRHRYLRRRLTIQALVLPIFLQELSMLNIQFQLLIFPPSIYSTKDKAQTMQRRGIYARHKLDINKTQTSLRTRHIQGLDKAQTRHGQGIVKTIGASFQC